MSTKDYELKYRCKLKAEIFAAWYRTIKEFAFSVGIHPTQLSKIISGIENPMPEIAHKMAVKLGIDFKKLRKLLLKCNGLILKALQIMRVFPFARSVDGCPTI